MKKKNKIHELADLAEDHESSLRDIYIEELHIHLRYLHSYPGSTNEVVSGKCCDILGAASKEVEKSARLLRKAADI